MLPGAFQAQKLGVRLGTSLLRGLLATSSNDRTAKVWSSATGELAPALSAHENLERFAADSSVGSSVVTASDDRSAKGRSCVAEECFLMLLADVNLTCLSTLSCDGASIATASNDRTAKVWGSASEELAPALTEHEKVVRPAALSPTALQS